MIPKGPWDDEFREKYYSYPKVKENVARFTVMVKRPKSEEQKEKMRIAKLDKKLSIEHREALSTAQQLRGSIRKEILRQNPNITNEQLWLLVREKYHEQVK
jgi:hypothetical protein